MIKVDNPIWKLSVNIATNDRFPNCMLIACRLVGILVLKLCQNYYQRSRNVIRFGYHTISLNSFIIDDYFYIEMVIG